MVCDIAGAILIALAIVGSRHETLVSEAHHGGQFSGANLSLFGALENQRHDAWFGLSLLVSGFLLQLAAAVGLAIPIDAISLCIALVLGIALLVWWYLWREFLATTRRDRLAASLEGIDKLNFLMRNEPSPPQRLHRVLTKLFR